MVKKLLSLILILVIAFFLISCQSQTTFQSTAPAPLSTTELPDPSPTITPTFTRTAEPTPTKTDVTPQSPIQVPACFVTSGIPFTFMPDGTHLIFKSDTGIQSINPQANECVEILTKTTPSDLFGSVIALSPNGDRYVIAQADNSIQVYQADGKKLLHTLDGHTNIVTELEFSPDGEKLYSASHDMWVRVWDRNGKQVGAFQPTGADDWFVFMECFGWHAVNGRQSGYQCNGICFFIGWTLPGVLGYSRQQ
jgi:WD40 repeat protein